MKYLRTQLQRTGCVANTKWPFSVKDTRLLCSSSRNHHPQPHAITRFGTHPPVIRSDALTSPLEAAGDDHDTVLAAARRWSKHGSEKSRDEARQYTGTFTELQSTLAGIKALKTAVKINHLELLNLHAFLSKLPERLCDRGSMIAFDDFAVWDDVVPILASKLRLHHAVIRKSSPYYKYTPMHGDFHILIKTSDQARVPEVGDEPLFQILHHHILGSNVRHWLHDFRQNIDNDTYPVWKLFILICKNSPQAMPKLEFVEAEHPSTMTPVLDKTGARPHQLRLINDHYDILIVECFNPDMVLSGKFLNKALVNYLEAIHNAFPSDVEYPFRFVPAAWESAQFLTQGVSALGWGDVRFVEERAEDFLPSLAADDLWRFEIHTVKHGRLGAPTIWHTKKHARLLAILHACDVVKGHLKAAYQSGRLTLEEFRPFARQWSGDLSGTERTNMVVPETSSPATYNITVNGKIVSSMLTSLRALVHAGFRSSYDWSSTTSADFELMKTHPRALSRNRQLDQMLYQAYVRRGARPASDALGLPVRNEKICSNIKAAIEGSAVTIITAATGSGKTTQIPQIILDEYIAADKGSLCNIVCTQPRRVSTIAVADRVASERCQSLGEEVGYKVRFDVRRTRSDCGITYMTSGYLLRILEIGALDILAQYSHIILDEVHARDVDTDLILTTLKNVLSERTRLKTSKVPKIILMSATINAEFFRSFFKEAGSHIKVTTVDVPGKMYHIEDKKLDDVLADLHKTHTHQLQHLLATPEIRAYVDEQIPPTTLSQTETENDYEGQTADVLGDWAAPEGGLANQDLFVPIRLIHLMVVHLLSTTKSGDILVFLPGLGEIDALEALLQQDSLSQSDISDTEKHRIFKLHSALYQTNYDVFKTVPSGCRRIVLATNIAETSITLPSVKFVIDTGLSRQNTFDQVTQSGTFGLQWISKPEVMQRKGRAGRTRAGVYYGIYSQARYDAMADAPIPEILRMSLDHLVLRCASSRVSSLHNASLRKVRGADEVLAGHALLTAPSPPEVSYVVAAERQLSNIHALTAQGKTTPMGLMLSRFPTSPAAAKAVLLGMVFRCLDATLAFGALREDSPLMYDPVGMGGITERRRKLANGTDDDRWADSQAFFSYDRLRQQNDEASATQLREVLSVRHDTYCESAQIARQTFETIGPMIGVAQEHGNSSEAHDEAGPLFPVTPPAFSRNAGNADLVKALALSTSGTRLACWNHKNWRAHLHPRALPHPKSVNHSGTKRNILVQRLRREDGDLLSYTALRTNPKDKYPWMHETSAITPLMAILFAESVSFLQDEAAFIINGWVKYHLAPATSNQDVARAAKIIWEYRKALDRFVAHVMQMVSLEPQNLQKVQSGELKISDFNKFFKEQDHPLQEIIVNSVIEILGIDSTDRKERAVMRALENEAVEAAVAKQVRERGDVEMLIESILEQNKKRFKGPEVSGASRRLNPAEVSRDNQNVIGSVQVDDVARNIQIAQGV